MRVKFIQAALFLSSLEHVVFHWIVDISLKTPGNSAVRALVYKSCVFENYNIGVMMDYMPQT